MAITTRELKDAATAKRASEMHIVLDNLSAQKTKAPFDLSRIGVQALLRLPLSQV